MDGGAVAGRSSMVACRAVAMKYEVVWFCAHTSVPSRGIWGQAPRNFELSVTVSDGVLSKNPTLFKIALKLQWV